jgi:hypothetical protein
VEPDFGVVGFPLALVRALYAMAGDHGVGSVLAELAEVPVVDLATSRVPVGVAKGSHSDESGNYSPLPNDRLAHTCCSCYRIDVACRSAWAVLVHHRLGRVLRQLLAAGSGVYLLGVRPFFGVALAPVPEASPASDVDCRRTDCSGGYRDSDDYGSGRNYFVFVVAAVAHGLVPARDGAVVLRHREVAYSVHRVRSLLRANRRMLLAALLCRSRLTDQVLGPYAIGR